MLKNSIAVLLFLFHSKVISSETWMAKCNSAQFNFDRSTSVVILYFNTSIGYLKMAEGTIVYDDGTVLRGPLDGNGVGGYNGLSLTEIELDASQNRVNVQYRNPSTGSISTGSFCSTQIFVTQRSPTRKPSRKPTRKPTRKPSRKPTRKPSGRKPTRKPSRKPTRRPSVRKPTRRPSVRKPTRKPSRKPTRRPSVRKPTRKPTTSPNVIAPTISPSSTPDDYWYDTGNPVVLQLYVDPINGNDSNTGTSSSTAFRTLTAAWNRVPIHSILNSTGYVINLAHGNYTESDIPLYWENRKGTFNYPVVIIGPKTAVIKSLVNMFNCSYVYLIGITIQPIGGDVIHYELCDHILLRSLTLTGRLPSTYSTQETVKLNQCQYVYIERCNISGAWDNAIDFVAVQWGHVVKNEIHDAGDWCMYAKGGSAYLRIEGNMIYECGTGGFTAGQGTGFEWMTSPWLHYEAYYIKFFNNIVHDTEGAAIGVNGGYNILMAYNTFYKVGSRSHGIEVVFGSRSCDGVISQCQAHRNLDGWGPIITDIEEPIPNRNVFIVNNVLYNPSGFRSEWQHFAIYGPRTARTGSNIPNPVLTDTNLNIQGNIIWNGPVDLPIGISDGACVSSSCNETQLLLQNKINLFSNMTEPFLQSPTSSDYRPVAYGSIVNSTSPFKLVNFTNDGKPSSIPSGDLSNVVLRDYSGQDRLPVGIQGAYTGASSPKEMPFTTKLICHTSSTAALGECPYRTSNCETAGIDCGVSRTCFVVSCY
jgi:hypothetical protein